MKKLIILMFICTATTVVAQQDARRTTTIIADPKVFATEKKSKSYRDPSTPRVKKVRPSEAAVVDDNGALIERILEKNVKAQGGRAALSQINTRIMRGTVEHSRADAPGKFESYTKWPNKSLVLIDAPGLGQFIEAFDGNDGWMQTPFTGTLAMDDKVNDLLRDNAEQRFAVRYRDYFASTSYRGEGLVGARQVHIVEATPPGQWPRTLYFDKHNGQLLRMDMQRRGAKGAVFSTVYFDSFAKVDGVMLPVNIRQVFDTFTMTFKLYEVKHNVHIDDSMFDKPKSKPAAPPAASDN